MLPSALIRKGRYANFWYDETLGVCQAESYRCMHREEWFQETTEWLASHGLSWTRSFGPSLPLFSVTFIDKKLYVMFKLAFDGTHSGRCGC